MFGGLSRHTRHCAALLGSLLLVCSQAFGAANERDRCMSPGFGDTYSEGTNLCAPPSKSEIRKISEKLRHSEIFKKHYADNCTRCAEKGADALLERLLNDAAKVRAEYFKPEVRSTIDKKGRFGIDLDPALASLLVKASGGDGFSDMPRIYRAATESMYVDGLRDYMYRMSWKTDADLACLRTLQNDAHLITIQAALNPKNEELRQRSFVCLSRLRGDLWRYPMLEKWPSKYKKCKADSGRPGISIAGACVTGAGNGAPIDARIPQGLELAAKRLHSFGHDVEEFQLGGCFNIRISNERQTKELAEKEGDAILTATNMSNHGEARACDIDAIVFKKGKERFRLEIKKQGKGSLSAALDQYAKLAPVPSIFGTPLQKNAEGEVSGLANWRLLTGARRPSGMSEKEFQTFQQGVFTRNALVDSGFYTIDPFVNTQHRDHFHVSVPRRDFEWQGLRQGGAVADFRAACALTRQAGIPIEQIEQHFKRKCF